MVKCKMDEFAVKKIAISLFNAPMVSIALPRGEYLTWDSKLCTRSIITLMCF